MSEIKLIKPSRKYSGAIMDYKRAFSEAGSSMDGTGNLRECKTAKEWLNTVKKYGNASTCPKDKVPSSTYLAVRISDAKLVGIMDFRHHINHPILSVWGGHIGYSVLPGERRKGYAKEMLSQMLEVCRESGLDKILVTCDDDNIASKKTILHNGGVFEKSVSVESDTVNRYWIMIGFP